MPPNDIFGILLGDHLNPRERRKDFEVHRYENIIAAEFVAAVTFRLGRT
jgi:hypothetical protein